MYIIGLIETHCGPNNLLLENYFIYQLNRKKSPKACKYSGGLAILKKGIKKGIKCLKKGIKILQTFLSEYVWFKLHKKFFNFDKNVYIAFIYVSPLTSSFSAKNDDIFELIEIL